MTSTYVPVVLRRFVISQAKGRCEYCLTPASHAADIFEIEHVIPISAGGETALNNLALACSTCNRLKATRRSVIDPQTGCRVQLFNPRRQQWTRHFAWSRDGTEIIGRTACGRATVTALRMNREAMRQLRAAWLAVGAHPMQRQTDD